jgi:hypothetical protein
MVFPSDERNGTMSKRALLIGVIVVVTSFALSAPSNAGYIDTVTAVNVSGAAAEDLEATFNGTGGSINDVKVLYSSGVSTTSSIISSGTGVGLDFNPSLPNATGVVVYDFTTSTPITLNSASWTFTGGTSIAAPPGTVLVSSVPTVPEPASLALLCTGAVGFLGYGWRKRKQAA